MVREELEELKEEFQTRLGTADRTIATLQARVLSVLLRNWDSALAPVSTFL